MLLLFNQLGTSYQTEISAFVVLEWCQYSPVYKVKIFQKATGHIFVTVYRDNPLKEILLLILFQRLHARTHKHTVCAAIFLTTLIDLMHSPAPYANPNHQNQMPDLNPCLTKLAVEVLTHTLHRYDSFSF